MTYTMMIPINPTTKKNSQSIFYRVVNGKRVPFIVPSPQYKQYQDACGWHLKMKGERLSGPLEITCVFYRKTKARCDLTNLLEAIDDILVHYGVISDDNFNVIVSHDGSRVKIDNDNPRTEIVIREIEGEFI